MASSDRAVASRQPPVEALRGALDDHPATDPTDADRLRPLLAGRAQFEAIVGRPPGGALRPLPPPFDALDPDEVVGDHRVDRPTDDATPASIGDGYERALAAEARSAHGQFYTPPPVAEALVRWAVDGPSTGGPSRLLDPAVGTGTFLLAALRRLRDRETDPMDLLDRLVGVDVDPVALHLAGLRLATAAGISAPDRLPLQHASFFDCAPAGAGGSSLDIGPVDAVVGNPPYVRAEALTPGVDHYRRHLAAFGPDGETPLRDGSDALSRRSDAYVYFITHATRFLRPGGRLALLLPTKWLMSEYGEALRRFLRDRYRVHAIVGVDGRAFDALVDTALLLAERDDDAGPEPPIRFRRVSTSAADGRLGLPGSDGDRGSAPTIDRPQTVLTAGGSLARFLEVPAELLALFESDAFVRLDELAEVARGTMTGANRFFFVDEDTVERFGIESRFLRPAVKSLRSVARPAVEAAEVDRHIVDIHPFVAEAQPGAGETTAAAVTDALAADGHDGLLGYVEHAEAAGWHDGRTCQSRSVWFDLGLLRAPAAFVPKLLRERLFAIRNGAGAIPSNAIDGVWPADGVAPGALHAVLCASAGTAAMEVTGRDEAGLLQLMTYETASLPTLDIRTCSSGARRALVDTGEGYAERPGPETLAAVDAAVDAAFDLALSPARLRELGTSLRRRRLDTG